MPSRLTRRVFLERTALTAAGTAWLPRIASMAQASGMFLSLNGAVAPRAQPWPATAELAARIGYGGIDFPLASVRTAGAEPTRALFRRLNLQPTIASLPFTIQAAEAQYQAGLGALEETASFLQEIGATRLMVVMPATVPAASGLSFADFRAMYKDRLSAVGKILAPHDVRLAVEFLGPLYFRTGAGGAPRGAAPASPAAPPAAPTAPASPPIPFIWNLNDAVKLATEAGPNIGVILDIWHWHHSKSTVADILATDKSRIVHVHMSDAREMAPEDVRDNMRLMSGEGAIDTTAFLQALKKIGYAGGLAPEPLGRIPMDMSTEEAAKLGYDTTLAVAKKAGVM